MTVKEALKDMTPEQRERFLEERKRKFADPVLNMNSEMIENLKRRYRLRRINKLRHKNKLRRIK